MTEKNLQLSFFITLLAAVFVLMFFIFLPYLGVLVLAATFAVIFQPVYRKILALMRGNEGLAALLSTVFVMIIIVIPITFFGVQILREARDLYVYLSSDAGKSSVPLSVSTFLRERLQTVLPMLSLDVGKYLQQLFGAVARNFGSVFSTITQISINFLISIFSLYYLFKDGARLRKSLTAISPLSEEDNGSIIKKLELTVNSVVRGTLIVAVIQGVLAGIGFWIFGIPSAALWGSLTVISSIIPAVGTALITVPAALYLLFIGNTFPGIGLLIWSVLVVGTIDNLLRPKLIQRGVKVHPFFILLSVIGGISLFGGIGFVLGPLVLSLFFALLNIYPQLILKKTILEAG